MGAVSSWADGPKFKGFVGTAQDRQWSLPLNLEDQHLYAPFEAQGSCRFPCSRWVILESRQPHGKSKVLSRAGFICQRQIPESHQMSHVPTTPAVTLPETRGQRALGALVGGGDWFSPPPRPLTHRAVTGVVLGPCGIALGRVILIPICLCRDT